MARIKVRAKCDTDDDTMWKKILDKCSNLSIIILKLLPASNSFSIIVESTIEADKLFSDEAIAAFDSLNVKLILPPNLRASRTLLMFNIDPLIYDREVELIKADIMQRNNWCRLDEVIKLHNARGLKLVFPSSTMVNSCIDSGLKVFQLFIPGYSFKRDIYCPILMCYRCYALDSHTSVNCDKPSDYKICSNCSSTQHIWKECTIKTKKCVNCGGVESIDYNSYLELFIILYLSID